LKKTTHILINKEMPFHLVEVTFLLDMPHK